MELDVCGLSWHAVDILESLWVHLYNTCDLTESICSVCGLWTSYLYQFTCLSPVTESMCSVCGLSWLTMDIVSVSVHLFLTRDWKHVLCVWSKLAWCGHPTSISSPVSHLWLKARALCVVQADSLWTSYPCLPVSHLWLKACALCVVQADLLWTSYPYQFTCFSPVTESMCSVCGSSWLAMDILPISVHLFLTCDWKHVLCVWFKLTRYGHPTRISSPVSRRVLVVSTDVRFKWSLPWRTPLDKCSAGAPWKWGYVHVRAVIDRSKRRIPHHHRCQSHQHHQHQQHWAPVWFLVTVRLQNVSDWMTMSMMSSRCRWVLKSTISFAL